MKVQKPFSMDDWEKIFEYCYKDQTNLFLLSLLMYYIKLHLPFLNEMNRTI
jgi:hypothetical protein